MKIVIDIGECRNEDCGDWYEDADGTLQIRTTPMPIDSQIGVAIHELIEWRRCMMEGVTDKSVTDFDAQFLEEQKAGKHSDEAEAGNDLRAPYFDPHQAATYVERSAMCALKVPWAEHETAVLAS